MKKMGMMVNEGEAYIARMASIRDERTSHYSHILIFWSFTKRVMRCDLVVRETARPNRTFHGLSFGQFLDFPLNNKSQGSDHGDFHRQLPLDYVFL
jgi:hypothetical protein